MRGTGACSVGTAPSGDFSSPSAEKTWLTSRVKSFQRRCVCPDFSVAYERMSVSISRWERGACFDHVIAIAVWNCGTVIVPSRWRS